MKIVILDGYTANPGDLSWEELENLGEVTIYDRTAPEQVVERAREAEAVLTNKVVLSAETMSQLPQLRYIGVLATGYNVVDTAAARERGIVVTNIPAYSTMSVAQMVFAHLLHITHHVARYSTSVHAGAWEHSEDFSFLEGAPLLELDGMTMGIVGLGNTGLATARIALAFGMRVLAYSSKPASHLSAMGFEKAESYEQLFREADVVSLHCPLTPETNQLVNAERLALMKPSAILINTGRGPLIDEQALADALNNHRIYAAAMDVLTEEPPRHGSPLLRVPFCYITPHIAWATLAARRRLVDMAVKNLRAFQKGTPTNVVNR